MPPICYICSERFFPDVNNGLIYFASDNETEIFKERVEKEHIIGHPPNAFWFCSKHFDTAKTFSHLSKAEALPLIKSTINSTNNLNN